MQQNIEIYVNTDFYDGHDNEDDDDADLIRCPVQLTLSYTIHDTDAVNNSLMMYSAHNNNGSTLVNICGKSSLIVIDLTCSFFLRESSVGGSYRLRHISGCNACLYGRLSVVFPCYSSALSLCVCVCFSVCINKSTI